MASPLSIRRLLRESAPVVVILLFWLVLGEFANRPVIATGLLYAGVLMTLLYTIVRGVRLAESRSFMLQPTDIGGILRENVRVVLPAGAWFFGAYLINFIAEVLRAFSGPHGVVLFVVEIVTLAFTGAGVAVVLLYALVVGLSRLRGTAPGSGTDTTGATPADD